MIPNAIEREIVIEAPVDVVWRVVTEPEQIKQWFAAEAEVELRVGGGGRLRFQSGQSYSLQIEAVEPPRRFAFRWVQPQGSIVRADNSMLVEFTLHPEAGGTRLRVVESGFDGIDWSDDEKMRYAEDHTRGWHTLLDRLRAYAPTVQ
ncbi:MAG TPA: SRPBCC domain-containing protein [Candidatus Dormibacteraeota bacterium]|nr:SRPBCC domain-containing protein [Candidatus Dormibacteraeota bacterium]